MIDEWGIIRVVNFDRSGFIIVGKNGVICHGWENDPSRVNVVDNLLGYRRWEEMLGMCSNCHLKRRWSERILKLDFGASNLNRTLSRVNIIVLGIKSLFDFIYYLTGCTGERIPGSCKHPHELNVVLGEAAEEFHRQNLTEVRTRAHNTSERQICFRFSQKIGPHHQTGVDDGHIFETRIFVDDGAHNREINVGRCQLSVQKTNVGSEMKSQGNKNKTCSQLSALSMLHRKSLRTMKLRQHWDAYQLYSNNIGFVQDIEKRRTVNSL